MGLSVILITKNEAHALPRALDSVRFADQVVVLDSGSSDGTQELAGSFGAQVFESKEWPGFGPQKNLALAKANQDWVLSLDADEWLDDSLARKIQELIRIPLDSGDSTLGQPVAYRIRRRSIFIDRKIRFGDWRRDRVVRLFRRGRAHFSSDLVHERLIVEGRIDDICGWIEHHPVLFVQDAKDKMWSYNRVAAKRIASEERGGHLRGVLKAIFSLLRSLVLRAGVLDGIRGIQLAWFNAYGTYLRYSLAGDIQNEESYLRGEVGWVQKVRDYMSLLVIDHGILRFLYPNKFRLRGGLYRINQPSPKRLEKYKDKFGIRTVINLRGRNNQLGWFRLEEQACRRLGLTLVNIQVYSRGLVDVEKLLELKKLIETMELPAVVHCKSGADRAGFFSVMYRHFRLGEPIEYAKKELGLLYGHSKSAKTGILDHFYQSYLSERRDRQTFIGWCCSDFDREALTRRFSPKNFFSWIFDSVLRRE